MDFSTISGSNPMPLNPKSLPLKTGAISNPNEPLNPLTTPITTRDVISFSSPSIQLMSNVNRFSNPQDPIGIENRLLGSLDQLDALGVPGLIQNEIPTNLQNNPDFALQFSDALVNRLES